MRLPAVLYGNPLGPVSIHASVKDATGVAPLVGLTTYVSIHASVKDATLVISVPGMSMFSFNPRICKRCDVKRRITVG